jgi:hypothetical protein
MEWIRLGLWVGFTKRKGLKYKFQHKSVPTIRPWVCFVKIERLNYKTLSQLVSPARSVRPIFSLPSRDCDWRLAFPYWKWVQTHHARSPGVCTFRLRWVRIETSTCICVYVSQRDEVMLPCCLPACLIAVLVARSLVGVLFVGPPSHSRVRVRRMELLEAYDDRPAFQTHRMIDRFAMALANGRIIHLQSTLDYCIIHGIRFRERW